MSETLITFPGGQAQKDALLAALAADKAADRLIKGVYEKFDGDGEFRGCAVGCTIHALDATEKPNDHSAYERLIGVPWQIAELEDAIFEGLPADEAMEWPERFTAAIPVRVDLRPAFHRFMARILADPEHGVIRFAEGSGLYAIDGVAAMKRRAGEAVRAAVLADWAAGANWATVLAAGADAYRSFADRLIAEMQDQGFT